MIVAAGAADGEAQKRRPGGAHHVVEFVGSLVGREDRIGRLHPIDRPANEKPGRRIGTNLIAHQLLLDELIVRFVSIDRFDHPVSIRPSVGASLVRFKPVALGKPYDVEPVPPPPLAVMRRRQQPVDEFAIRPIDPAGSPAGLVKRRDFLGRRREADEVEGHAADERVGIGLRVHRELGGGECVDKEGVDRRGARRGGGHRRPRERLKRPVVLSLDRLRP